MAVFYAGLQLSWTCPTCLTIWKPGDVLPGYPIWKTENPNAVAEHIDLGVEDRGTFIGGDVQELRTEASRRLTYLIKRSEDLLSVIKDATDMEEEKTDLSNLTHEIVNLQYAIKRAKEVPPLMKADIP